MQDKIECIRTEHVHLCQLCCSLRLSSISSFAINFSTLGTVAVSVLRSCGASCPSCGVSAISCRCVPIGCGGMPIGGGHMSIGGGRLALVWRYSVELSKQSLLLLEQLSPLCVTCQHSLDDCCVITRHLQPQKSQTQYAVTMHANCFGYRGRLRQATLCTIYCKHACTHHCKDVCAFQGLRNDPLAQLSGMHRLQTCLRMSMRKVPDLLLNSQECTQHCKHHRVCQGLMITTYCLTVRNAFNTASMFCSC